MTEEGEDFEEEKKYAKQKSKTPVLDNFSTSLHRLISKDKTNNLTYFKREREVNSILRTLIKPEIRHVAIVGAYGTGRETLIKSVVDKALNLNASIALSNINIRRLDFNDLVAGTKYRGQFEERVKAITKELERCGEKTFLFFSNVSDAVKNDLLNISIFLKSDYVRIITTLTPEEAEKFFEPEKGFGRYFNSIRIGPTNKSDTYEILKLHIPRIQKLFSIEMPENLLHAVIEYSNLYLPNEFQPLKSISVIEEMCAIVELQRSSNPNDSIHACKAEFDNYSAELDEIKAKKNLAVTSQNFLEALKLKEDENRIQDLMDRLKETIVGIGFNNRIRIQFEDILTAIHNKTGIEIEKLKAKEEPSNTEKARIGPEQSALPKFEVMQAQSILQGFQVSIKVGLAFVLIPHNKEFDELFLHNIKPALEAHGLMVLKADSIFKPGNILSQVWSQIRTAEVIVADVSERNPNVIFELGLCYGIQRCPILLTRDPSDLPFNLRNLRYIQYENSIKGAHKLGEDLKITVGDFLAGTRTDLY